MPAEMSDMQNQNSAKVNKKRAKKVALDKKLKVFLAVAGVVVALWIAGGYVTSELSDRAMVLGLGIDYDQTQKTFVLTAEVISQGETSQSGPTGGQSKLLVGKGETVPLALHDIFRTSGKNPSLGQTGIVILGEGMHTQDLKYILSYFIFSDAFKDGVTIAACKGTARDLFESTSPVDSMISFALQSIIQKSGGKTGSAGNFLQNFMEKQTAPSRASYLNEIAPRQDLVPKSDKTQEESKGLAVYNCIGVQVFSDGYYVDTLSEDETRGFVMVNESSTFDNFAVEGADTLLGGKNTVSVGIDSKSVQKDVKMTNGGVKATFCVKVGLVRMKTDVTGNVLDLLPKTQKNIDDEIKSDVKRQITRLINAAVQKSVATDCDFFGLANELFKTCGNEWKEYQKNNPDYLKKTQFEIKVEITN